MSSRRSGGSSSTWAPTLPPPIRPLAVPRTLVRSDLLPAVVLLPESGICYRRRIFLGDWAKKQLRDPMFASQYGQVFCIHLHRLFLRVKAADSALVEYHMPFVVAALAQEP